MPPDYDSEQNPTLLDAAIEVLLTTATYSRVPPMVPSVT